MRNKFLSAYEALIAAGVQQKGGAEFTPAVSAIIQ